MIEAYFQSLLELISDSPSIHSSDLSLDERSEFIGFIRGNILFVDNSLLHFRELIDVEHAPKRMMYVYHYQHSDGRIIFRYDNTAHFHNLPSFPHHKHVGSAANVISIEPPDLALVLKEIESLIKT